MIALIWIDWYPYHHARLRALVDGGMQAVGIELVGRTGVHKGLIFRETAAPDLPLITLMPDADWSRATQIRGAVLLWKALNRVNPSVIFVPGYYTLPALAAATWGRIKGRRSVMMTESTQHDHARTWWKEFAKGLLIRSLFDYAICGGKAHVRYLQALGFSADRIGGCYDVVDNAFYSESAESVRSGSVRLNSSSPYFLFTGRLAPEKNVDGLIRAYTAYRTRGGQWPLVLVGAGPDEHRLRQMAAASEFGRDIVFTGLKFGRDLAACYAEAGCFVLPSTREPWGLVVNEAMASGLPVIVSDRCGCVEDLVVPGENGYRFNPAAEGDLESKLTQMELVGPQKRSEMARRSREIVSNISPERWAREVARMSSGSNSQGPLRMAVQP